MGDLDYSGAPTLDELARYDLNDIGNAMRLIRSTGGAIDEAGEISTAGSTLLFVRELGVWAGWNGKAWDLRQGDRLAERAAHKVAAGLLAQATRLTMAHDKPTAVKFIRTSGNASAISAMLRVAESYLQVSLDDFDADPLALSVANGTLRISDDPADRGAISFSPHDPRDRITRLAPVKYDPAAEAPTWARSLEHWQPAEDMRAFLARLVGYCLTGKTHEQAFTIFQGKGRDGKSTFVNTVRELLGDYGGVADVKTFMDNGPRGGGDASPDVARLAGDCRLVSVAEPARGAKLNESMIKSFTGGAPIVARQLRKDLFEFTPRPKVIMEANSRPRIGGDDEGIWRRIRLVPWENQLSKAEVDHTLPARLRLEASGILNWALAGAVEWLSVGLAEPARVLQAGDDYRKGSSPFGEWFAECVEEIAGERTLAADFYDSFKAWAEAAQIERPMSQRAFGDAMADRFILRAGKDGRGRAYRVGARLRASAHDVVPRQVGPMGEDPPPHRKAPEGEGALG
jgi:putative DNA primase/helicase